MRAVLSSESYILSWLLWIDLYTVISFHYCTDFSLCLEKQGAYYSSHFYNEMQTLFRINHIPFFSDKKLCCSPLFFENWNFRKKSNKKLKRRGYCDAVRNALKLSDTQWNCKGWAVCYYEIRFIHWSKKVIVSSSAEYYLWFGR